MKTISLRKIFLASVAIAIASVSFAQADSSNFYLQKAQEEKAKGRKLEVVKNLEKAYNFNQKNQKVVTELANAYVDIRMLAKAREKFVQAESLGDHSAATYKQLMDLNFNMRQ